MPVIDLDRVTVRSGGRIILREVSLLLEEGSKALIRGPSGSGKSTLLNVIMGGVPVDSGEVRFRGRLVDPGSIQRVRREIAFVAQEPLLGGEDVRSGLLLPFRFKVHRKEAPSEDRIHRVLGELGLSPEILDQPVAQLSGGEKQRLVLARALLLEATVFLVDEVTSALDPESRDRVTRLLLGSDFTVLAISHLEHWHGIFNKSWTMRDGRLYPDS